MAPKAKAKGKAKAKAKAKAGALAMRVRGVPLGAGVLRRPAAQGRIRRPAADLDLSDLARWKRGETVRSHLIPVTELGKNTEVVMEDASYYKAPAK